MSPSTEHLVEQYYEDRLVLTRLNLMQEIECLVDTNLTMHELRAVLLVSSGIATTVGKLSDVLRVSPNSMSATVEGLVTNGYLSLSPTAADQNPSLLLPTEQATKLFDTVIDLRNSAVEMLTTLDPHDLQALVRGTRALRTAMEQQSDPVVQHR